MARILALDWDQKIIHLVAAQVGRGGARIERAIQWRDDWDGTPGGAEAAGRRLRERLKEAGLGGGPALIVLGRERVILKDVRFPQVPPDEEPPLVRFQASKELTDSPDEVVIDYCPLREPGPAGERQATAVIVRREVVAAFKALCLHAGLKLVGITPRPFGVAGALERASGVWHTPEATATLAVLTLGERWAELCVVRGSALLFARSLAVGPQLAGEVKRSLAVYAGSGNGRVMPDALYVAGNGEQGSLRDRLHQLLGVPVHPLDPFVREERVDVEASGRGGFTGAVGLVHLWGRFEHAPINFVQPRQARRDADPGKIRWLVAAGVAVAALAGLLVFGFFILGVKRDSLAELEKQHHELTVKIQPLQLEAGDFAGLKDWQQTAVPWLDEVYDLAARMEHKEDFKITHLKLLAAQRQDPAGAAAAKKSTVNQPIGQIQIFGSFPLDQEVLAHNLMDKLRKDKHLQPTLGPMKASEGRREFSITVDVLKQPLEAYREILEVPPARKGGGS